MKRKQMMNNYNYREIMKESNHSYLKFTTKNASILKEYVIFLQNMMYHLKECEVFLKNI